MPDLHMIAKKNKAKLNKVVNRFMNSCLLMAHIVPTPVMSTLEDKAMIIINSFAISSSH